MGDFFALLAGVNVAAGVVAAMDGTIWWAAWSFGWATVAALLSLRAQR